jgi:uncharacterized coiled-coil DUF342 family protein
LSQNLHGARVCFGRHSWMNLAGEMGVMVDFLKFDELETKINGLIEDYVVLKKRSLELEGLLQNKTMELEEANKKLGGLKEERDAVRTKVDSLLDLIQEIKAP